MSFNGLKERIDGLKKSGQPLSVRHYILDTMLNQFPYKIEDGMCEKLVRLKNGLYECGVYEDRPTMCRVDNMFWMYKEETPTLQEYYELTEKACRHLMHAVLDLDEQEINLKYDEFKQISSQLPPKL
jgi:Fe-S-cluster containining protein